jgi:transcriptional regulator with XRE-family HTH domain
VDVNASGYGPVVSSALLTNALRRLRQTCGKQQGEVADALQWQVSRLIRIENGAIRISRSDLESLLRHYEVADQEQADELIAWAEEAGAPGWWDRFHIADKAFERYVGYESGATSIRMAQSMQIPGILQTEDYARLTTGTYTAAEDVDSIVLLRLERQREVFARAPEQLHILDEAVLRRPVGDVMRRQLQRLMELARQPEITIRVIPLSAGPHSGLRGPFVLLGFDVPLGSMLYLESPRAQHENVAICEESIISNQGIFGTHDAAEEIARYEDRFEMLNAVALEPAESTRLLDQIAGEMS